VDHWLRQPDINPPTVEEFTDQVYENRREFRYGQAREAADYIRGLIEKYVKEER